MDVAEIREMIRELRELSDSDDVELFQESRELLRRAANQLEAELDD
ncbi:MAG TPA: hypothetical protein VK652_01085 [Steroidobacteraceae bacterium]|nr:hypothetical protein [Steroidobacteraceae bacterium]